MSASQQMLKDVRQSFEQIIQKYPQIKGNLNKCYKEIEDIIMHTQATKEEKKIEKKEKIKTLLKKFNDKTFLDKSYEGLVYEVAENEDQLIEVINKLSKAIIDCKKKMLSFASRQGLLLKEAKQILEPHMFKHVRQSCGFCTSHTNFLIALHNLFETYPKLCYCAVPIRIFNANMVIIREICQEEPDFWSTV